MLIVCQIVCDVLSHFGPLMFDVCHTLCLSFTASYYEITLLTLGLIRRLDKFHFVIYLDSLSALLTT